MMSPYLCWSARSFSRNTAGINSDSRSTSAMMALPQETILRIAWPQRLFSARKSSIVTATRYSTPRWWEWLTGLRAGVCGSWGEARTVDQMAPPLKEPVLKKEKVNIFFLKEMCVYVFETHIQLRNTASMSSGMSSWGEMNPGGVRSLPSFSPFTQFRTPTCGMTSYSGKAFPSQLNPSEDTPKGRFTGDFKARWVENKG